MIPKSFFILFLLGTSFVLKGQPIEDSLTSSSIESIINNIHSEKAKLIFTKKEGLIIDSTLFRKVTFSGNEQVKILLPDYTSIKINANDFWGLITEFGQCQRFYQGETYIVWHTKAPYIYRDYAASDRKIKYFYSKSLVSEIIPLTKESITKIEDAKAKEELMAYLKTHDIEKAKDGGPSLPSEVRVFKDDEHTILSDFVMFHLQIAWAIAEAFMLAAK